MSVGVIVLVLVLALLGVGLVSVNSRLRLLEQRTAALAGVSSVAPPATSTTINVSPEAMPPALTTSMPGGVRLQPLMRLL